MTYVIVEAIDRIATPSDITLTLKLLSVVLYPHLLSKSTGDTLGKVLWLVGTE